MIESDTRTLLGAAFVSTSAVSGRLALLIESGRGLNNSTLTELQSLLQDALQSLQEINTSARRTRHPTRLV